MQRRRKNVRLFPDTVQLLQKERRTRIEKRKKSVEQTSEVETKPRTWLEVHQMVYKQQQNSKLRNNDPVAQRELRSFSNQRKGAH